MRQRLLIAASLVVFLAVVAGPAAAIWFITSNPVTPADAKAKHFSIQAARGKDEDGQPLAHFRVAHQVDRSHRSPRESANLNIRKDGKLVAISDVTTTADNEELAWDFKISAEYVAESKFEVYELRPPFGNGATVLCHQIELKDFFVVEKPPSGNTRPAPPARTRPLAKETPAWDDGFAASSFCVSVPVNRANAKANHISIEPRAEQKTTSEDATPQAVVHFSILRTAEQPHEEGELANILTLRKSGKLVARGQVPASFNVSPDYLEESVVEIHEPLPGVGELVYKIKLGDFYPAEKPRTDDE